jgi:hypothetical protein
VADPRLRCIERLVVVQDAQASETFRLPKPAIARVAPIRCCPSTTQHGAEIMQIPVQVTLYNVGRLHRLIEEVREGAQVLAQLYPTATFCGITVRRHSRQPEPLFETRIALSLPGQPEVLVSSGQERKLCVSLRNAFGAAARSVPVARTASP